jgi:hypothetical protein
MTNRRLVAMISGGPGGRRTERMTLEQLTQQPRVTRLLQRTILGVGAAGMACATLAAFGGNLMDVAASAAVTGGGFGSGPATESVESAASAPAEVAELAAASSEVAPATIDTPVEAPPAAPPTTAAPPAAAAPVTPRVQPIAAVQVVAVAPAPGSVEAVITEVFGAHARSAIGVARCESHLNPGAISRGGANWGLFQINKAHRGRVAAMGYRWEDLLDARVNALVAKSIFDEQGWRPWACRHAAR